VREWNSVPDDSEVDTRPESVLPWKDKTVARFDIRPFDLMERNVFKGIVTEDEYRQIKEQERRTADGTGLRLLQKDISFLLELFVRIPDLPVLHG